MLHPMDEKIVREGGNSPMSDRPHKRLSGKSALQCPIVSFPVHTSLSLYNIKAYFPTRFSLLCRVKNEFVICKRSDMFAKK